jgi:hypothetical protein
MATLLPWLAVSQESLSLRFLRVASHLPQRLDCTLALVPLGEPLPYLPVRFGHVLILCSLRCSVDLASSHQTPS